MKNATTRLRELVAEPGPLIGPGTYDTLSARLSLLAGHKLVYIGGWATGARTGITEPMIGMSEQLDNAGEIAKNVDAPVITDGGTGFGEVIHAMRTVQYAEKAGIAGIHIEDQWFPKRVGYHRGSKTVVPIEVATAKLAAALEARTDPDFFIIGRTDAWGASNGGFDETLRRLEAYAELGVDALMPLVFDFEQAAKCRELIPEIPMVWLAGTGGLTLKGRLNSEGKSFIHTPEQSVDQIVEMGYDIILYPNSGISVAASAVRKYYEALARHEIVDLSEADYGRAGIEEVNSIDALYEMEQRFEAVNATA